jgi:hypothetical protein
MKTQTQQDIERISKEVSDLLIAKNKSYGDSALNPTRVFSKADAVEQLLVRIDGHDWPGDNDIDDLIGYLILLKIAKERNV